MKRFSHIINEAEESAAHRQAVAQGLKYRGFGYWEDPNTGEVKFKTDKESDQLVPVDQEKTADTGTKTPRTLGGDSAMPGGGPESMGSLSTADQMQQKMGAMPEPPPVGSMVKGAPEPGEELAFTTLEWEPGPDGSTCVHSDDPPADVPEDTYVNRSNNMKWRAGPDGTNYSNIDYGELLKDLRSPNLDNFLNRMKMQKAMPHPIGRDENV